MIRGDDPNDLVAATPWTTSISWPVAWGDMDAFEHVNNAVFMRWLENARIAWLAEVSFPESSEAPTFGPVVRSVTLEFVAPVVHPDTVTIRVRAQAIGTSSVTLLYEISSYAKGDAVVATGCTRIVLTDFEAHKSIPISSDARARIIEHDPAAELAYVRS